MLVGTRCLHLSIIQLSPELLPQQQSIPHQLTSRPHHRPPKFLRHIQGAREEVIPDLI
jgi:hypothetical protein